MTDLEAKKARVDSYLQERDTLKQLDLEKIISGHRPARDFVQPIVMTVFSLGILGLLFKTQPASFSFAPILLVLMMANGAWAMFESRGVNKQIAALKKYLDLRLEQLNENQSATITHEQP